MGQEVTIAVDGMGGDQAPDMVIGGLDIARRRHDDVRFLIFGDQDRIAPLMRGRSELAAIAEIRHTDQAVRADDKPSQALRQRRDSSMGLAVAAVKSGEASGIVSAGNSGALMAMSKLALRTIPGIGRPAMCATMPTSRGRSVVLDLGANVDCDERNLVQFAMMGAAFARIILGIARPTVGLLNVGEEEIKGHEALRLAAGMLRAADMPFEFVGFIEGNDITAGTTDVVVTDGFTGNVALKVAEGTSRLYTEFLRHAFQNGILAKLGYLLARGAMAGLRDRVDPRLYNGAVFLGLNGVSVKSHGGMDAVGFAAAVNVAVDLVADNLKGKIIEDYQRFGDGGLDEVSATAL